MPSLLRRCTAEAVGTFALVFIGVGSVMSGFFPKSDFGVFGVALAHGLILGTMITATMRISGGHLNPAVTIGLLVARRTNVQTAAAYIVAQLVGGMLGVWIAHLMFGLPLLQLSGRLRDGPGQAAGEAVATFGLVLTVLGTARARPACVPASVALYIGAAYWFASSTSFANPAITIARSFTDSFAGIAPASVPAFVAAQLAGAVAAHFVSGILFRDVARRIP